MMLHEYHARMMSQDRERWLREVAETARLHAEGSPPPARRRRWARVRRRRPQPQSPPATRPGYSLRPSPR